MPNFCLNTNDKLSNFEVRKTEELPEIEYLGSNKKTANAYELIHTSGARLLYLENEDPEMSFTIGFKTLPKDSTGVFHILEHSVLCGSRKFPVKEPFTNLLKSSMQTFLNAMTFPDKTIYPVASTNEKDLYNLVDVYMDAVLFPNIYKNKNIFLQEGGHKTPDGFSGVVYNEMKGVYSDPEEHIFEGLMSQLFSGSCYAYSSGGEPKAIETLTYEEYLAQHNSNYSLENAYIIVYGKLDIKKILDFLDTKYLSKQDEINKWREGTATTSQGKIECEFNGAPETLKVEVDTNKENSMCGAGFVLQRDHKKVVATRILLDALCNSNESPLKKALLKENFAKDIDFEMLAEVYDPFIICTCRGIAKSEGEKLISRIQKCINDITKDGISQDLLKAAISNREFKLKEKIPSCTNGLDCSIAAFDEWLYDENCSTSSIKYLDDLTWLKEMSNTNYFNELANEIFVNNMHNASVEVVPTKLDVEKVTRSNEEIEEINKEIKGLEKWQTTPDEKSDEAKLPVMEISDIGEVESYPKWKKNNTATTTLEYDIPTNGITHVNRYYSLNNIDVEDFKYASILCSLLGKLDTEKYSSEEINIIAQEKLGHMNFSLCFYEDAIDINKIAPKLCVRASALDENCDYLASFIDEIIQNTKFDDEEKIKTILGQRKIGLEQCFINSGHSSAIGKALSQILPVSRLLEKTNGTEFYCELKELLNSFDLSRFTSKLNDVSKMIFSSSPTISFAGKNIINGIKFGNLKVDENKDFSELISNKKHNFAVKIPSQVNYCAMANDMRLAGLKSNGANICASKIISLDYLWNNVRVKNGAYGAGLNINIKGSTQFYSYRDPQLEKTFESFANSYKWLNDLDLSQRELDNYIISTVAKIDAPISTRAKIIMQDNFYFTNTDPSKREESRTEVLNTTLKDIKDSVKLFEDLNKTSVRCVFGGNLQDISNNLNYKFIDLLN